MGVDRRHGHLLVVSIALGAIAFGNKAPDPAATFFDIQTPSSSSLLHLTVSPDGNYLSAIVSSDKGNVIWLRALNHLNAQTVNGSEGANIPFWSPDSRFLAFFAGGKLKEWISPARPANAVRREQERRSSSSDGVMVFGSIFSGTVSRFRIGRDSRSTHSTRCVAPGNSPSSPVFPTRWTALSVYGDQCRVGEFRHLHQLRRSIRKSGSAS